MVVVNFGDTVYAEGTHYRASSTHTIIPRGKMTIGGPPTSMFFGVVGETWTTHINWIQPLFNWLRIKPAALGL